MNSDHCDMELVHLGIRTQHEYIVYIHCDSELYRSEGLKTQTQVRVEHNDTSIVARLSVIGSDILHRNQASLSESAWNRLGAKEGQTIQISHISPITSLSYVRAKIFGKKISDKEFHEIINDIVERKYTSAQLASFVTACGAQGLDIEEIVGLTKAMINTGDTVKWDEAIVVDKHCVGGIPGNRTTPLVVAIVTASGLCFPKTSSRAITSPAGTADTIETMTNVTFDVAKMRKVIAKENSCLVWGGAINLSPADDILISAERSIDLDPEGQMIASVLSKKAAAGSTHVLIDIPVGPTAKIRTNDDFLRLKEYFNLVGYAIGLNIQVVKTDGSQPIGMGIGPALEARDILAILHNEENAPQDLKQKSLMLAGLILEQSKSAPDGKGIELATTILESGRALKKFLAICEAQGGFTMPQISKFTHEVLATHSGTVTEIDNRSLAQVAKLAGAPQDKGAGLDILKKIGDTVTKGDAIYRIYAESEGALHYSLRYAKTMPNIVYIAREKS